MAGFEKIFFRYYALHSFRASITCVRSFLLAREMVFPREQVFL